MKKKSFEEKVQSKYGVSADQIGNLSTSRLKELQLHNGVEKKLNDKFSIVKKPIATIIKGGTLGAGVAGAINTAFPNIVPVVGSAFTEASQLEGWQKLLSYGSLASKPIDVISGPAIIGIGAAAGAVLYVGYTVVKNSAKYISIANDRNKAKKLYKK